MSSPLKTNDAKTSYNRTCWSPPTGCEVEVMEGEIVEVECLRMVVAGECVGAHLQVLEVGVLVMEGGIDEVEYLWMVVTLLVAM